MKTIAVINEKGGTAKTTTTVSLAAALGEIGQRVLVVDLDGQAASSRWMGVEGDARLADALIAGEGLEPISNVLPNVDLAPASGKIDSVAHELRPTQGGQLRRVLAEVQGTHHYDYILLDCPPSLGNRLIGNAMLAATHAIVPVETSILALDGLRILLTMLKDIRQGFDHDIELLGVLACRYDARTRLSRLILSELNRALPGKVFRTVIHNTIRIQECPAVVKSILDYAPDCPAAKDYRMLAQELVTGEVDVESVEEVEDLAASGAIDTSDQQTVLDFRHRAAEFFGRPIEDHPAVEAPHPKDTREPFVPITAESEEGDWPVDVSPPDDAIDEDLVVAVTGMPDPSADEQDGQSEPAKIKGDAAHWKARRTAKYIAAGFVLFFVAGVVLVHQASLVPFFAKANHHDRARLGGKPNSRHAESESAGTVIEMYEEEPPAIAEDEAPSSAESEDTEPVSSAQPVLARTIESPSLETTPPEVPTTAPAEKEDAVTEPRETATKEEESPELVVPAEPEPQPQPQPQVDPISLTFSGMMGSAGHYSASINSRWLKVGDEILGATLVDVDPMFAEVEWQGQRYRLRMGEESILRVDEGEQSE